MTRRVDVPIDPGALEKLKKLVAKLLPTGPGTNNYKCVECGSVESALPGKLPYGWGRKSEAEGDNLVGQEICPACCGEPEALVRKEGGDD